MIEIAERYNAIVHCVNINNKNENIEELQIWKERFNDEPVQFHIVYNEKDAEKAVLDFIDTNQIDVVASVARHKTFFEKIFGRSFTKKLTYHSKIPVYVFHEQKE